MTFFFHWTRTKVFYIGNAVLVCISLNVLCITYYVTMNYA